MMQLYEQGKWQLEDPVAKYIPEFANLQVKRAEGGTEPQKSPMTMQQLMSHSAGFGISAVYESVNLSATDLQGMVDKLKGLPLESQPGTAWDYGPSVNIQGYIVEKLSGQSLGQFMQEQVFGPLKMTDTGFSTGPAKAGRLAAVYAFDKDLGKIVEAKTLFSNDMPDYSKPPAMESGGGGLVSTTMDYARFCQMILNKGELDGVRILSPASVELMDTNVIPHSVLVSSNGTNVAQFNEAVGFGLDFMVVNDARRAGLLEGDKTMSWGGAAGTWFWIDPANDILFVGMIQRMGGTGGDDLGGQARTLTYQALLHPEK
jgi:CubicO group peptidase (beta-lactamase class C family)